MSQCQFNDDDQQIADMLCDFNDPNMIHEFDDDSQLIADLVSRESHLSSNINSNKRLHSGIGGNEEQEFQFDDDDTTITEAIKEAENLKRVFGHDGRRRLPTFPRRKKIRRRLFTEDDQSGGRIVADSDEQHREYPPIFEVTSRVQVSQNEMPEFRRAEETTLLTIKQNLQRQDIVLGIDSELSRLFMTIMSPYLNKCNDDDHLAVTFQFAQLTQPIFIFFRKENFDSSALLKQLYAIAQSKRGNFLSGDLYVKVAIIRSNSRRQMSGNGRLGKKNGAPRSLDEQSYLKNCASN